MGNIELMTALLDAAVSTANSHRNKQNEAYSLGHTEALANALYLLLLSHSGDNTRLENYAQKMSTFAIDRLNDISPNVSNLISKNG
tara:strand:+ start:181 stop:438 length:258 start_codon:yes stop_codon:yes gene_type:complete